MSKLRRGRVNRVKQSGISQLTGDVVGGPGFGVIEVTIPVNTVTYAQQQDVSAASRLIGRGSAFGPGDPEEITLGAGLLMVGTELRAGAAAGVEWTVLTNGDDVNPELIFIDGDVITLEAP